MTSVSIQWLAPAVGRAPACGGISSIMDDNRVNAATTSRRSMRLRRTRNPPSCRISARRMGADGKTDQLSETERSRMARRWPSEIGKRCRRLQRGWADVIAGVMALSDERLMMMSGSGASHLQRSAKPPTEVTKTTVQRDIASPADGPGLARSVHCCCTGSTQTSERPRSFQKLAEVCKLLAS